MNLESPAITLEKTQEELFNFLINIENFEQLLPESRQKFEVINENRFLFQLKGMPEIVLEKKGNTPYSQIILGAASDKLPFTLTTDIIEDEHGKTTAKLTFEGKFNAMMAMMVKKPLQNFIDTLMENMAKL